MFYFEHAYGIPCFRFCRKVHFSYYQLDQTFGSLLICLYVGHVWSYTTLHHNPPVLYMI